MNEILRPSPDDKERRAERVSNWQSMTPGERLSATCELSMKAYGMTVDDERLQASRKTLIRIDPSSLDW
jgi:hypothetical protein